MKDLSLDINKRQYLELQNIGLGAFSPLNGFMKGDEFSSVVESMRLPENQVFPLPVVLDITKSQAKMASKAESLNLVFEGQSVGVITPEDIFTCDKWSTARQVFGTEDPTHPGVSHFISIGDWFLGGPTRLTKRMSFEFSEFDLTPEETRAHFAQNNWTTIVGFQTRNVPHRAHEYLLRLGLELTDGLFVQPLVGRKKRGDYTAEAILQSYRTLVDHFLPKDRVLLGVLSTAMRYAGPREAIFHAIIRRNYGCTHFIVGRDHAGVGNFYGKYEAQELTRKFEGELGIEILRLPGPFYCSVCDGIVTERTCPHFVDRPDVTREVQGTEMRGILSNGNVCPPELMRPKVVTSIQGVPIFIDEDSD